MKVYPRGDYNSPIWCLLSEPSEEDKNNHVALSGSRGYAVDKIFTTANLPAPHIKVMQSSLTQPLPADQLLPQVVAEVQIRKPPIILTMGETATGFLVPETRARKKPFKTQLDKYAGSLLSSPYIKYPHYIIPIVDIDFIWANWAYRDVLIHLDLGHAKDELDYWKTHGSLRPLPIYDFLIEPTSYALLDYLSHCLTSNCSLVSVDIETIRPTKSSSVFKHHPGYPYTIGVADSPTRGTSFSLWDYTEEELLKIWRSLDILLRSKGQIGQNYFNFDAYFLEALGFQLCLEKCQDTLIRHHILWPELPHKLQFQTKQYTRQPYYKDEGKGWSPKYKKQLMRYNALDVCVTYEIYNKQEEEFKDRPHLR